MDKVMKRRIVKYGGALTDKAEERAIIKSIRNSRKTRNWQSAEEGRLFEGELSKFLGVRHATLCSSGSCAGLLALQALDLPKGSEVIIPAVTFPTIFNIILQSGLRPVVCDVGMDNNLDLGKLKKLLRPSVRAVIAVHALGNPIDLPRLRRTVGKGVKIILDNCDGLGTEWDGRPVERYADISFTSFHAAHIVSMGVGGGVFTDDPKLHANVRMYRDWGRQADTTKPNSYPLLPADQNPRFIYEKVGYNFQVLELQAAMGRVQLRKLRGTKNARTKNFKYLKEKLGALPLLYTAEPDPKASVCWFAFPIFYFGDRGPLIRHLEDRGIETRSMFAGNILAHPAYEGMKVRHGDLGMAELILRHAFWVSCHPALSKDDLDYIIKAFEGFLAPSA